jgi:hypothetical protein
MKKNLWLAALCLILSCTTNKERRNTLPKTVEAIEPTKEQTERRNSSEAYCERYGVPIYENKNSLYVDTDKDVKLRKKDEVVDRALALCYVGLKSEGTQEQLLKHFEGKYLIVPKLTLGEKTYVSSTQPTDDQTAMANWRYESLHVLLWALSFTDSLSYPNELCNVAHDVKMIFPLTLEEFRDKAELRSKKEILDQADLILRLHWACVNARIKGDDAPAGLNPDVVYERHYALNWLINYMGLSWDEMTTDT